MINVEQIYQSLRDLTTKGKGGYTDSDAFNKNSKRAELLLFQYYAEMYERERKIPESMYPFLKTVNLPLTSTGLVALPSDYAHFVLVNYATVLSVPGGEPIVTPYLTTYLSKEEEGDTLASPIRKPNVAKNTLYYTFEPESKIKLHTGGATGLAQLQYLRFPIYAVRGWTLDTQNDEQDYNSGTSTNYEWPVQEENNLVDLLLWFDGLIIRDSQILQWAQAKTATTQAIVA